MCYPGGQKLNPIHYLRRTMLVLSIAIVQANAQGLKAGSDAEPPMLERHYADVHVLAIGVNDYEANTPYKDLSFALNDANEVANVLQRHYNYKVQRLTNQQATRDRIYKAITDTAMRMSEDDVFIFYFAGHGATQMYADEKGQKQTAGYIIPYISENLREITFDDVRDNIKNKGTYKEPEQGPEETDEDYERRCKLHRIEWEDQRQAAETRARVFEHAIDMIELRDRILDQVPGKHKVMLFDSCFSGFATVSTRAALGADELDSFIQNFSRWNRLRNKSAYALTAGSSTQEVIEHTGESRGYDHHILNEHPDTPINHGVFTYELISVLRSVEKGDAISVNQLWEEVQDRVIYTIARMGNGYEMHPQVRDLLPSGESGEFVFVADPIDDWLQGILVGLNSDSMKPDDIQDAVTRSTEVAEQSRTERLDREKLESEAMLVYISRQAQRGDLASPSELENDPQLREKYSVTRQRAASGDETAMATLAYMHAYGLGTKRDMQQAGAWAVEAKGEGIAHASVVLTELLENGYANELNIEGVQQLDQQILKDQTQQSQAAGGIAILLAAQTSDNDAVRGAGTILGLGMAAESFFSEAPPMSYEAALAEIDLNMQKLYQFAEGIDDLQTQTQNNDFESLKATLLVQINALEDNGLKNHSRRVGRGRSAPYRYPRRNMAFRSANQLIKGINELKEPKSSSEVRAFQEAVGSLEMPYCEMIALSDYLSGRREWAHK